MSHIKREGERLRTTASLPPFSIVYNVNVNFDLSVNISVMWLFPSGFQVKKKTIFNVL